MATVGQPFASGNWVVKEGSDDEFVARWITFVSWSKENAPGADSFNLLRDQQDPHRYLSFSGWSDQEAMDAWRSAPEFARLLGACRELCEDFAGHDYIVAAVVGE